MKKALIEIGMVAINILISFIFHVLIGREGKPVDFTTYFLYQLSFFTNFLVLAIVSFFYWFEIVRYRIHWRYVIAHFSIFHSLFLLMAGKGILYYFGSNLAIIICGVIYLVIGIIIAVCQVRFYLDMYIDKYLVEDEEEEFII